MPEQLALTFVAPDELAGLQRNLARRKINPVDLYLSQLDSDNSKDTMGRQLRSVAAVLFELANMQGHPAPERFPWHLLRYEHTAALRAVLIERYAPPTVNLQLGALRGVLRACKRLRLMSVEDCELAGDLEPVTYDAPPAGRAVSAGELAALFAACQGQGPVGARDAAMLALLYGGGLRVSAAIAAAVEHYDPSAGALDVVKAKGRKRRTVFLEGGAKAAVDAWLIVRATAELADEGPILLPVAKGGRVQLRPMSRDSINKRLVFLAKRAQTAHLSPHDLRRTFVSDLLDRGADIATVQRMAGHAHVSTTTRYDRRGQRTEKAAAELLHVPYVDTSDASDD